MWQSFSSVSLMCAPKLLFADLPATNDIIVQWHEINRLAYETFSKQDALQFQEEVEKAINMSRNKTLPEPLKSSGDTFKNTGQSGFLTALTKLITPSLQVKETGKVERFLAVLNEKKFVQGWTFSRNFRGCFLAYLEAVLSQSNQYELHATFRPYEGSGCRNTMLNKDYKGMTVVLQTGVRQKQ
jgi:hypothetical protein